MTDPTPPCACPPGYEDGGCVFPPGTCGRKDAASDPDDGYYDPDDFADELDGPEPGEECGRWRNGRLDRYCTKAGTEECDFECPYRDRRR